MIITIDLSTPRKLTMDMINNLIFRYRMKNTEYYSHKENNQRAILCIALGGQISLSATTGYSHSKVDLEHMCKYAELYSIPVIYSAYEIIKAKESLFQTIQGVARSGKKILIRKNK